MSLPNSGLALAPKAFKRRHARWLALVTAILIAAGTATEICVSVLLDSSRGLSPWSLVSFPVALGIAAAMAFAMRRSMPDYRRTTGLKIIGLAWLLATVILLTIVVVFTANEVHFYGNPEGLKVEPNGWFTPKFWARASGMFASAIAAGIGAVCGAIAASSRRE